MRKVLLILILIFSVKSTAQDKLNIPEDKFNHLWVSSMAGFTANGLTYLTLTKLTNWQPETCKSIPIAIGVIAPIIAGHIKEKHDSFYSTEDMVYNGFGACLGSITFRIVIGSSVDRKHVPYEDQFEMEESLPLTKRDEKVN